MVATPAARTRRSFVQGVATTAAGAAVAMPFVRASSGAPASVVGAWSAVHAWPDVAIHLHYLPNGKILTYADDNRPDGRFGGFSKAFVVSIPQGQAPSSVWTYVPNDVTNLFCSGHNFLPDGRLFVVGGHRGPDNYGSPNTTIFDYGPYRWTTRTDAPMAGGRWYASTCLLGSGEVLVLAGSRNGGQDQNPLPQVWQTNHGGGWRSLTTALHAGPYYPPLYLKSNGNVAMVGWAPQTLYLNPSGTGKWSPGPNRNAGTRDYGSSAMYDVDKVIYAGGGLNPTNACETIDLNVPAPAWKYTAAMAYKRRHLNLTLLPDGKVLATGGSSSPDNDATLAVTAAEMWDPATGKWTLLASSTVKRVYHSTALLLRDGRVLSAGGGRPPPSGIGGGVNNENAEIYSPPYLFKGPRPQVLASPTVVKYGSTFAIGTTNSADITDVTLVKLGSVTHTFNMAQRISRLSFARTSVSSLQVQAPTNPNAAPPGHWMLFVLNRAGVPCVAPVIQLLP